MMQAQTYIPYTGLLSICTLKHTCGRFSFSLKLRRATWDRSNPNVSSTGDSALLPWACPPSLGMTLYLLGIESDLFEGALMLEDTRLGKVCNPLSLSCSCPCKTMTSDSLRIPEGLDAICMWSSSDCELSMSDILGIAIPSVSHRTRTIRCYHYY